MTSMEIFKNSQILKLFLLAALLIITPLLSAPIRSKFLYFIVNILIVAVGAEAGLLSIFSDSPKNNKRTSSPSIKPHAIISELILDDNQETIFVDQCSNHLIVKCSPEKVVVDEEQKVAIEELPSTPSIFFIEDQSVEDVDDDDDEREEVGEISGQELYQKAEMFIGDFYKQLKMQREESWKKLHDLCHKAF